MHSNSKKRLVHWIKLALKLRKKVGLLKLNVPNSWKWKVFLYAFRSLVCRRMVQNMQIVLKAWKLTQLFLGLIPMIWGKSQQKCPIFLELKASIHRSNFREVCPKSICINYVVCRQPSGSPPGSRRRKIFESSFYFSNQLRILVKFFDLSYGYASYYS